MWAARLNKRRRVRRQSSSHTHRRVLGDTPNLGLVSMYTQIRSPHDELAFVNNEGKSLSLLSPAGGGRATDGVSSRPHPEVRHASMESRARPPSPYQAPMPEARAIKRTRGPKGEMPHATPRLEKSCEGWAGPGDDGAGAPHTPHVRGTLTNDAASRPPSPRACRLAESVHMLAARMFICGRRPDGVRGVSRTSWPIRGPNSHTCRNNSTRTEA